MCFFTLGDQGHHIPLLELIAHRIVRQASAGEKERKTRLYHTALVVLQNVRTFSCVAARENIALVTKLTIE